MSVSVSEFAKEPRVEVSESSSPVAIPFGENRIVLRQPIPKWCREVVRRICALGDLSDNWDSYGGRRIQASCAVAAIEIALDLFTPRTPTPIVVPTNQGGLQLEWHRGGMDLELRIDSASQVEISFANVPSGEEFEETFTTELPRIAPWIARVSMIEK